VDFFFCGGGWSDDVFCVCVFQLAEPIHFFTFSSVAKKRKGMVLPKTFMFCSLFIGLQFAPGNYHFTFEFLLTIEYQL
jgi:hypothetical protein